MPRLKSNSTVNGTQLHNLELEVARLTAHVEAETILTTQTIDSIRGLVERHNRLLLGDNGGQLGLYPRVAKLTEIAEHIDRAIEGDGSDHHPGLVVQVDRLQQLSNSRTTHFKLMWTVIGTLGVGFILDLIKVIWFRS